MSAETQALQVDIFGETQPPAPELPAYQRRDASAATSRLFEPQMEGQLTLDDVQLPNEGSRNDGNDG